MNTRADRSIFQAEAENFLGTIDEVDEAIKHYIRNLFAEKEQQVERAAVLQAVIDSIGQALQVIDNHHKVILANRPAILFFGNDPLSRAEDTFMQNYKLLEGPGGKPIPGDRLPYRQVRRTKRLASAEGLLLGPKLPDKGIWVRMTDSPVLSHGAELVAVVSICEDITERKKLESERERLATLIVSDLKHHLSACNLTLETLLESGRLSPDDRKLVAALKLDNQRYLHSALSLADLYHRT